jgi:hypothetical protein
MLKLHTQADHPFQVLHITLEEVADDTGLSVIQNSFH